jgi:hypothetical protein
MPSKRAAVTLALALLLQSCTRSDDSTAATMLESYERATTLLNAAVEAHGGVQAVRSSVRQLHVRTEGFDYHRNQSRAVAPPYDSTTRRVELFLDLPRGQIVSEQLAGYPGGTVRHSRFVTDGSNHYFVDLRGETYVRANYPPAAEQYGQITGVPHGYLYAALAYPSAPRRYMGRLRLSSGTTVDAVMVMAPNNLTFTIGLDPTTHHVRAVLGVTTDAISGTLATETEYSNYRDVGGVLLPAHAVSRRGGDVVRSLAFVSAATGQEVPPSHRAPPATFTEAVSGAAGDTTVQLAPGVWTIRVSGARTLLVEFSDHALVVDAAPNVTRQVLAQAAAVLPEKPIRYVVPTHHHDDHFGGVRDFAAAGVTTVTTPGNADYFRGIFRAPRVAIDTGATQSAAEPGLEIIVGKQRRHTHRRDP